MAPCLRSRALGVGLMVAFALVWTGCAAGYYTRTLWGGAKILAHRKPIERLVRDPHTKADLRQRLRYVQQARDFASRELFLPDNKSYRTYSEVRKKGALSPYVLWNVIATPELSVEPVRWCLRFAGCVPYRGYFSQQRAERFGSSLDNRNYDLELYGVRAYSTLGHFADPVLSTFLHASDQTLVAGYIFHELAHQVVYVKGDSTFNESFATLVEQEGLSRWLQSRGEQAQLALYRTRQARDEEFLTLVRSYRDKLATCYAQKQPDTWKRAEKARLITQLRADYEALKSNWGDDRRWDGWFAGEVNNADFALTASYHGLVPGLRRLLEQQGHDLAAFYQEVKLLAALDRARRLERLESKAQE